jgi:drug/metabolite transporter (DMT)-like permease
MNPMVSAFGAKNWTYIKGVTLVLLAGMFWSIGGIVVRMIEHANAWQIVFYRSLALAITLTVVILWRQRGGVLEAFRKARVIAALAGFCLSLGFACWIFALTHTTVANALFLLTTQPFITAILALLVLGERVLRITWLTMGLTIAGVGVMMSEGIAVGTLFGNLMGLGAALGLSGFTVAIRKGRAVDMFPAAWWAGVFAILLSGGMLLVKGQSFGMSSWDLGMCTILGVVQIGFGLMAFIAGSRYLPAAELALLSITEVILGPIWVWLGVGEVPSRLTLVGGAIVLTAVVWRALYGLRKPLSVGMMY